MDRDIDKLKRFKDQLGYGIALFFSLVTGTSEVSYEHQSF